MFKRFWAWWAAQFDYIDPLAADYLPESNADKIGSLRQWL